MNTRYLEAHAAGLAFDAFLDSTVENRELWHAVAARVRLADEVVARVQALEGDWKVLVLADDWCGDAVNTLPVVEKLLEAGGVRSLRVIPRDAFPDLMDRHLSGTARSIPIVLVLSPEGEVLGQWGPRPSALQALFEAELRPLPSEDRYRAVRTWYARDRGVQTAEEIAGLLEGIAALR
jgi:hypothetical protein